MAIQDHPYSSEFKATVTLEALAQNKRNLDQLSDKFDVPVSLIKIWILQLEQNASAVYATTVAPTGVTEEIGDDVIVDVSIDDEEVTHSISYGVMSDNLNYKKLTFWSVLGIIFVLIFVQGLKEMYDLTTQINQERISANSEYEISAQNAKSREQLSSFGVVDIENGIYRIPIDSVINDMAVDGE